jgi:eukaryotic-like serine/threonine-protein kinase
VLIVADLQADIESVGPYRIIRCLGEGGKGRVYEAEQSTPVRRTVALKILRSTSTDAGDSLRFSAEQQALALMDHPGIAKVFDAGTEADGRQWFAMELIHGLPLTEFADKHRLTLEARIHLFIRVCRAVQHAHQKGVIHRDLKPSNIMVSMEDGVPTPKVIDFGVAKAVGLRLTDETLLTQFGAIIGTPAYMSPEQAEGTVFEIDTRADIYSLGVILFELLVGCLPVDPRVTGYPGFIAYLKEPTQDAPTPTVRFRQLPEERQQDLARDRRTGHSQLRAALSGDLRWIIMAALEKETTRRYHSAAALGDDLERFVRGDVINARPPSAGYVLRKILARNRVIVAATILVVLAVAGGLIATTIGMVRAEREATIATTVSEFLENIFAEASPFTRSGEEVTARQLLERAAANIETELDGNPLVQGRLMSRIGAAYRDMGLFDEATPLLQRALQLLEEGNAAPDLIADARSELGYHLIFMSEFDRSRELLDSAISFYRDEYDYSDPRFARALGSRVFNALRSANDVPGAYALLQQSLGPIVEALGEEHPRVGHLRYLACWSLRDMGRRVEALDTCRESLALLHRIYDIDAPVIGHNTLALGHTYRALGQCPAALNAYAEAIRINSRLYGADHAEIAYALASMARCHLQLSDRNAALESAGQAVAMMERVHGIESTEYATTLITLADTYADLRRFDEAEAQYQTIIAIDSQAMGSGSRRVAHRKRAYAAALLQQGRLPEASELVSEALAVLEIDAAVGSTEVLDTLLTAGQVSHHAGELGLAESRLREAREIAESFAENFPVELATANLLLAQVLLDRGELIEGCSLAEAAQSEMQSVFGPENWRTAAATTVHGACLLRSGDKNAGMAALQEGVQGLEATVLPGDIYLARARALAAESD